MAKTMFDCARVPGDTCSVHIVGERDEVLRAAHDHLASTHNMEAGDDLKAKIVRAVDEPPQTYGTWFH
jgi:predicted small metal-binding protein